MALKKSHEIKCKIVYQILISILLNVFQSIDQQKKYGGGRGGSLSTSSYGTQKKSLGTRYAGLSLRLGCADKFCSIFSFVANYKPNFRFPSFCIY